MEMKTPNWWYQNKYLDNRKLLLSNKIHLLKFKAPQVEKK